MPLTVVRGWVADAERSGPSMPAAMVLATSSDDDPRARVVLVTAITDDEVTFRTSTPSSEAYGIRRTPHASGMFFWPLLGRQAILTGVARECSTDVSERAYASRPRYGQLLAWVWEGVGQELDARPALSPADSTAIRSRWTSHRESPAQPLRTSPSWTTFSIRVDRVDLRVADRTVRHPARCGISEPKRGDAGPRRSHDSRGERSRNEIVTSRHAVETSGSDTGRGDETTIWHEGPR